MAVTRKPKMGSVADVDINALINKGGSVASETGQDKSTTGSLVLRLPTDMLTQVDTAVKARPIKIPRHTWILEAIHEKLSRETS